LSEEFNNLPPEENTTVPEEVSMVDPERMDPRQRPGNELFEWLQMILVCILAAVFLFNCVIRLTRVDGESMDNTLQDGELMLVRSIAYDPQPGDIIVLNKTTVDIPGWDGMKAIVKRVIATGGQTVDVDYEAGLVYVDGEPLDEPYIRETMYRPDSYYMQQTHWEVPEGSIFVMGDNRNNSTDSRDERLGCIDEEYVLGKVVLALWPMSKFGLM